MILQVSSPSILENKTTVPAGPLPLFPANQSKDSPVKSRSAVEVEMPKKSPGLSSTDTNQRSNVYTLGKYPKA